MTAIEPAISKLRDADAALAALSPKPAHLTVAGLEAVIVGGFLGVDARDWVAPGLRERAGATLRGCAVERLVDPRAGARPYRVLPCSGDPAARAVQACGVAQAVAADGAAVLCFLGVGSASYGAFHEALNLAALRSLPVIFLVAAYDLTGEGAPLGPQLSGELDALARAHGLSAASVDGADADAVRSAVRTARDAGGPWLIAARLSPGG